MTGVLPLPLQSITVLIVAHQSGNDLDTLLPLLVGMVPELGLEIVLVDNDSSDQTSVLLERFSDDITIIANPSNLGFAKAVNQGLSVSRSPYVLLLNPDARIDSDSLLELRQYLTENENVAAVAPRLEFPDGSLQPSRGSFPTLLRTLAHLFRLKKLMPPDEKVIKSPLRLLGKVFSQYSPPEDEQLVDYTTGACVLLKRSALEEINGLDDCFFLYYEEIDMAKRLADAGYRWVFLNSVIAEHAVATSSNKAPLRPFFERYRSLCYYYHKHHSYLEAFWVRQMLYITILIRWGLILFLPQFRIDPAVSIDEETAMYRRLLKRRTRNNQ